MKKIEVNNTEYAVNILQQNQSLPNLVMLHGFMGDHRVFDHVTEKLCQFCNPIGIDLLGHGKSAKPEESGRYREDKQISDLVNIFEKLNLNNFFLLGYSMGGRLALHFSLRNFNFLQGLILESTNCGISDSDERKKRRKIDLKRAESIKQNFEQFLSEWQKLELFQSPLEENESIKRRYNKIQSEQSPHALAASLDGFGTGIMSPICEKLKNVSKPVHLLAGTADQKYQKINRNLVDQFPNATFASIEAGHRTHVDNPPEFVNQIRIFIAKNS